MRLQNPYLAEYRRATKHPKLPDFLALSVTQAETNSGELDDVLKKIAILAEREQLISKYAYAVPDTRAVRLIARYSPVIEIGAGTGYLAWMLRQAGADVVAVDKGIEDATIDNRSTRFCSEVLPGDERTAGAYPDRTLLLIWPPKDEPMASGALTAHMQSGGRRVIYVGERDGAATADSLFFELLKRHFREVSEYGVPRWYGMRDMLLVFERY